MLGEYEEKRRALLEEHRQQWAGTPGMQKLEDRFGPGTFGHHEAFHVTNLIVKLIDNELLEHSAVLLDPGWYRLVREAQWTLYSAYLHAGSLPPEDGTESAG